MNMGSREPKGQNTGNHTRVAIATLLTALAVALPVASNDRATDSPRDNDTVKPATTRDAAGKYVLPTPHTDIVKPSLQRQYDLSPCNVDNGLPGCLGRGTTNTK